MKFLTKQRGKGKTHLFDTGKDAAKEVLRPRVVVSEAYINEVNANSEESGVGYVIDEKATKERDEKQLAKQAAKMTVNDAEKIEAAPAAPAATAAPAEKKQTPNAPATGDGKQTGGGEPDENS